MEHRDTESGVAVPVKRCGECGLELNTGQLHLTRSVCIRDLQTAIAQAVGLISTQEKQLGQLKTTNRLAWILIAEVPGKKRLFTPENLKMPAGASLHAESTAEGLVVTAIVKTVGVPS